MSRSKGCAVSETNVVEDDANKKSDNGAEGESNSTDTELTPTKKVARTFSQVESESAEKPVQYAKSCRNEPNSFCARNLVEQL